MHVKTNTLLRYTTVFGERTVIDQIEAAKQLKSPGNIVGITNPLMRFLINTTYVSGEKLYTHRNMNVPSTDYAYFRLVSAILNDLDVEINANESYKKQLANKILQHQSGPMLATLNEVLVAAYYKYIGIDVTLNSSEQAGAADIDLVKLPFASDTKVFPNKRLLLEDAVNRSGQQIINVAKLMQNEGLLLNIFNPDRKLLQSSLKKLADAFSDPAANKYNDDVLAADVVDNSYPAADFQITFQPHNVTIFLQASWDMWPSIVELKKSMEKAIDQAKVLSKQAIPWVMVPRDANRDGIELAVLRFEGKLHEFVLEHDNIFMIPVYSLEFDKNRGVVVMDIFQTGQNTFNVNPQTFQAFINNLMSRSELYV